MKSLDYKKLKHFNKVFAEVAAYTDQSGETKVQEAGDQFFEFLFDTKTRRIVKCDTYFSATCYEGTKHLEHKIVGLVEYKNNIDMTNWNSLVKVLCQSTIYLHRLINDPNYEEPNVVFVMDRDELVMFEAKKLIPYIDIPGVDYSCAASGAYDTQPELKAAISADVALRKVCFPVNLLEDELSYVYTKATAIASGKDYTISFNKDSCKRAWDSFNKCLDDNDDVSSNDKVALFLDALRFPEKVSYANGLMSMKGHTTIKVNESMGSFLAHFDKPRTSEESREMSQLYDTFVADLERRRHGFFITPSVWVKLAHKYLAKVLGDNWESDPNNIVWDCCAGTKALTRWWRFPNLYLTTIDPGEFQASEDLNPEAKATAIFDFLNDSFIKLPPELLSTLKDLHNHPEKKLVLPVNPPYGQAKGKSDMGSIEKGSTMTMVQDEMNKGGLGCKCSDLFIQFNYRMAKLASEFKLKPGQLVIATFNNPTWMNGIGSTQFLNWYLDRMSFKGGFLFNASEFAGCKPTWGIAFSVFTNERGGNRETFTHDVYENEDENAKYLQTMNFVNPIGRTTMDEWWKIEVKKAKGSPRIVAATNGYITAVSTKTQKYNGGKLPLSFGYCKSYGNVTQNTYSCMSTIPADDNNTNVVTMENLNKACVAYCCRSLIPITWINAKDNYLAPSPEVEASDEYNAWMRDCRVFACFSYQTSITGTTTDGESYDYHNAFCPFKKSEVLEMRNDYLRNNEVDEVPYVVSAGFFDNMSNEASDVIAKYKALLIALEPHRAKAMKDHPELQLDRWDAGWVQYRGNKKSNFFFAETKAKKEYDEFTKALKALADAIRPGIYKFGFLEK